MRYISKHYLFTTLSQITSHCSWIFYYLRNSSSCTLLLKSSFLHKIIVVFLFDNGLVYLYEFLLFIWKLFSWRIFLYQRWGSCSCWEWCRCCWKTSLSTLRGMLIYIVLNVLSWSVGCHFTFISFLIAFVILIIINHYLLSVTNIWHLWFFLYPVFRQTRLFTFLIILL